VPYEDVAEVENSGDANDDVANVRLNDDDGETLGSLEYVRNPERIRGRIEGLVERVEESDRGESDTGW